MQRYSTWLTHDHGSSGVEKEFWRLMNQMSSQMMKTIRPTKFVSAFVDAYGRFVVGHQQDSHEFLMVMLDRINILEKLATGVMKEEVECQACLEKSLHSEDFTCLSIEIPKAEKHHVPIELESCIRETLSNEMVIDDDWACTSCGGTFAEKSMQVASLPSVLLLHLKRFVLTDKGYQKNQRVVRLPEFFMMHTTKYQVIGTVNHWGASMNSGHYTANINAGQWKCCDDLKISASGNLKEYSSEIYLVVCQKC